MRPLHIGLIEDDALQAQLMLRWLEKAGHSVVHFPAARPFLEAAGPERFDLLVIDWMLPDLNGDAVLQWVRANLGWGIGVLFATARSEEEDVAYILGIGADDFIRKPVGHAELLARIEALSRRIGPQVERQETLAVGPFRLDPSSHLAYVGGEAQELTRKEFELAAAFFNHQGELVTRDYLLKTIWGHKAKANTRTVDIHVSRLKRKLNLGPDNGWVISPIHGLGYRFEPARMSEA